MRRFVELYGRLRDAGLGASVELELPERARAKDALAALASSLGSRGALLEGVVLATESAVLSADDGLPAEGRLAALPPVCGG